MSSGQPDKDAKLIAAYEEAVGHAARNFPEDHPGRWEFEYRGSKEDKQRVRELLGLPLDDDEAVVIEGQLGLI